MKILPLILIFCASAAYADIDYFDLPRKGSVFHLGDTIQFLADKSDDDVDKKISANLYRHIPIPHNKLNHTMKVLGKREDDDDDDGDSDDGDSDNDDDDDGDDKDGDDGDSDSDDEDEDEDEDEEQKEFAFSNLVLVKTIHYWLGSEIQDDESDFLFQWKVENVTSGTYHVQMDVSRIKTLPGFLSEEEEDDEHDILRSHTFKIVNDSSVLKQTSLRLLRSYWFN